MKCLTACTKFTYRQLTIVKRYCLLSGLLFLASLTSLPAADKVKVILAGDSTVAAYKAKVRPLAGWGEFLPFCFNNQVTVINHATGGASTRTFRTWRRWDRVMKATNKGDYILIQFGHDDEKAHYTKKYSDPDTTFQENLKRYIKEAKAIGAIPVLITPPVRLKYDAKTQKLQETHIQSLWNAPAGTPKTSTTYHDAVRKVAKETQTPLLDLNKASRKAITAMASYETMQSYYRFVKPGHKNYPKGIKDITHFSVKGAALLATLLAEELRRSQLPLAGYLNPTNEITTKKLIQQFKHGKAKISTPKATLRQSSGMSKAGAFSRLIDPANKNIPPKSATVKWRYLGPGVGGSMFGIGISPIDPNVIITGGDMGASARTEDGGKSWQMIGGTAGDQPGIGGTWNVQFAQCDPNTVWIVGLSAYKSTDGGKNWQRNAPFKTLGGLAIDPKNPDVVYISEGYVPRFNLAWCTGNVYKTTNGGKSWQRLPRPYGDASNDTMSYRNYSTIVIDPTSSYTAQGGHSRIYIVGRGGFCRSDDGGKSWKILSEQFGRGQITDLVLTTIDGKSILLLAVAGAEGYPKAGIYKSIDGGANWTAVNNGLEEIIASQRRNSSNKQLIKNSKAVIFPTLLANSKSNARRVYMSTFFGSARSDDLGENWVAIAAKPSYVKLKAGNYVGVLKNNDVFKKDFGGGFDGVNRLAVSGSNADMLIISDNDELSVSYDAGKTFNSISFAYGKPYRNNAFHEKNLPKNKYTHKVKNIGQHNVVCMDIKIDPFDRQIYYASFMDLGLNISRDGGEYWAHPTFGIPARGHSWSVAVDPKNEGLVIAASKMYRKPTKLYRSLDKGLNWKVIGLADGLLDGNLHTQIHSITIDLHSPVKSRTILAATTTKGLFKSTDCGDNWTELTKAADKKLQRTTVMKLNPQDSNIIYLGTKTGLYGTINGGKSWHQLGKNSFEKVETISICQSQPNIIYLTAHYPGQNQYWGKRGLFKSTDAGKNWKDITPPFFVYVGAVAVNPYNPDYLYAANYLDDNKSEEAKMIIVRSTDGGKSWKDIGNGIAFCRGANIIIDDFNAQHIFVLSKFAIIEGWDKQAPVK